MHKQIDIEAALLKMRELLEMVNRGDTERRDAMLSALQAILQAMINIDDGAAVVVLATDFKGSMGVYTLNAGEDTVIGLARTLLGRLDDTRLDDIPVEHMGAVQ
jgi:hypothetical protein